MRNIFRKTKVPVVEQDALSLKDRLEQHLNAFDNKEEDARENFVSFLKECRNSELIDLSDFEYNNSVSMWDYGDMCIPLYEKEIAKRTFPNNGEVQDLLKDFHINWAGKDSRITKFDNLLRTVEGIQKKVDNIMKVLSKFDVCLKADEAVELAKG